jgi:hypothetical protein
MRIHVGEHLSDEEEDLGFAVQQNADDDNLDDAENEIEKLHYPKQIIQKDHSVAPLIRRIG